jgi:hypothetical protein
MYLPTLDPAKTRQYIEMKTAITSTRPSPRVRRGRAVRPSGQLGVAGGRAVHVRLPGGQHRQTPAQRPHTRIINEFRELVGIEIFSRGHHRARAAAKALKNGRVLGFFSDQDAGKSGVFIEFFGKMASTPLGLAVFARGLACR